MIVIVGKVRVDADKIEDAREPMTKMVESSRSEMGASTMPMPLTCSTSA